jgi:hypothetical protein
MRHGKEALPELDSELQGHIGRHLKAAYQDILNQPVPDRFRDLLQALAERESDASDSSGEGHGGKVIGS